jgi:hypothetical protein
MFNNLEGVCRGLFKGVTLVIVMKTEETHYNTVSVARNLATI